MIDIYKIQRVRRAAVDRQRKIGRRVLVPAYILIALSATLPYFYPFSPEGWYIVIGLVASCAMAASWRAGWVAGSGDTMKIIIEEYDRSEREVPPGWAGTPSSERTT